ncbi:histidine kinase [Actinoplanes sp. NPDC026623]|uniref:sensor histidine kinase n=1 Tax=Actinoplanes sp. NPDC026623 TaxID=3155610 RepID=UPI0033ECD07A
MGRLIWVPVGVVCVLASWYGTPVQLRLSATAVVLAAALARSLITWRLPLGIVAAGVSLAASVWAWRTFGYSFVDVRADGDRVLFWTTIEVAGLAVLAGRPAYPGRLSGLFLLVPGAAVSLRLLPGSPLPQQLFLAGLGASVVGSAILLGRHLDGRARAAAEAVHRARSEQRHLLAADLHDYVAHDVAAIAVMAQSMRLAPGPDVRPALGQIEQAAARALRRLDRSIALLRIDAAARPRYRLADVPELTANNPMPVTLTTAADDEADIPAVVQDTAHRVITEALTNAGRHAPHDTEVQVRISRDERQLHIVVVNELRPHPKPARGAAAATGLAALDERVRSLGGELNAGAAGSQWRVAASLPLD